MCGIIGYIGPQDPKGILLDGLRCLEYRGYDSAGIAILEPKGVELFRCEGRIQALEKKLTNHNFTGPIGIGHTRWATHGAPTEINAHPHRVGAITLAHNGIIENYLEHKAALLEMGRTIQSDTDSEIVAHLIDIEVQKKISLRDALLSVLPRLKGSYAFVIMSDLEPDKILGVRNGAPLLVGIGKQENFIASDVQAILSRTNQILFLKDGEFAIAKKSTVEVQNSKGEKVRQEIKTIQWTPDQMDKSGYRHYMLKEIHEQSISLTHTIENNINHDLGTVDFPDLGPWQKKLAQIKRITIVACGTARHAGLIGKFYLETLAKLPVDVDFGSEFRYRNPMLEQGTLVILISQSGETADTLAGLREAKAKKVPTLSICNVRDSSLARESDIVLYTNAGPEIGVASTKAFTTQLAILYMLSIQLGRSIGSLNDLDAKELTTDLVRLPLLIDRTLQLEGHIEKIALEHVDRTFFFYMGRGISYPIALEGALKLKEISYFHAEGYPAGELKHGPIALVDRDAAIIALSPRDKPSTLPSFTSLAKQSETVYDKMMSNIQEVKSRGGRVFSIGTEGDQLLKDQSLFFAGVPQASWALNPILISIPIQLFAYHVALLRGTDVDKPRNLAKSVTVE